MKKITLALFFAAACSVPIHAAVLDSLLEKQLDSAHYVLLKPRISAYLEKAEDLTAKISSSADKKEIRKYSKQLCQVTDSMLETADRIYGYRKISGNNTGLVILPNGTVAYAYFLAPDVVTGIRPSVHDALYDLSSAADTMRWFPGSKKSRMKKIGKLIGELKTY